MSTEAEKSPDVGFKSPDVGFDRRPPTANDSDEPFQQSLAELKRQLERRVPIEPRPYDPKIQAKLPREPRLPARRRYPRPHLVLLALAAGVALAAVIHAMVNVIGSEPAPAQRSVAVVVPPPPPDPVPPPTAADLLPAKAVTYTPPPPPTAAPVVVAIPDTPQPKAKLEGYEIMEIQTRLKAGGLNPGPLDGAPGGQTTSAIKQYQASKGQPQTGKLDRDLLKQLRQEPEQKK